MNSRLGFAGFILGLAIFTHAWAENPRLTPVTVGSVRFQVEIARTPQERELGLMFRRELPSDQGMLFEQPVGRAIFWMKNTYIPLDLLYFDAEGRLAEIQANAQPCVTQDCRLYPSKSAAVRYILELNAGEAAKRGIQPGDQLRMQ